MSQSFPIANKSIDKMGALQKQSLGILKDSMLTELQNLGEDYDEGDKSLSSTTERIADMVIDFEYLLKASVTALNFAHRNLKVKWIRNSESNGCDTLNILKNDTEKRDGEQNTAVAQELAYILKNIDWICEYKKAFREALRDVHRNKLIANDNRRDETIAENLAHYKDSNETEEQNTFKQSTTKDKLLSKTKQLSSNLIKGNQVLQTGLLQSDLNIDELKQQTHGLSTANDRYMQFETVFLKTNQLVRTLEKASHQEKRDVYIALGFLCMSISWVLWRRIFRLPTKLVFFFLFKFFKGILLTIGLVSKATTKKPLLAPPIITVETTHASLLTAAATIEKAVDEAMERILSHDEL